MYTRVPPNLYLYLLVLFLAAPPPALAQTGSSNAPTWMAACMNMCCWNAECCSLLRPSPALLPALPLPPAHKQPLAVRCAAVRTPPVQLSESQWKPAQQRKKGLSMKAHHACRLVLCLPPGHLHFPVSLSIERELPTTTARELPITTARVKQSNSNTHKPPPPHSVPPSTGRQSLVRSSGD